MRILSPELNSLFLNKLISKFTNERFYNKYVNEITIAKSLSDEQTILTIVSFNLKPNKVIAHNAHTVSVSCLNSIPLEIIDNNVSLNSFFSFFDNSSLYLYSIGNILYAKDGKVPKNAPTVEIRYESRYY